MAKTSKIIIISILIAIILLGIGYAAIQNITLNISSQATAQTDQGNFIVKFTGTPQVTDSTKVQAAITNDTNATISVTGLATRGEKVSATYNIQNASANLSADLSVSTTNNNTEYFTISSQLAKSTLTAGEATTVTVEIELEKNPITASVSALVGVQLIVVPVQPGEEGSSGTTNDFSQTPVRISNRNIGDYIDLGNDIINTASTKDDWRILYKDSGAVYVILADYLPADQVPISAGLDIELVNYLYGVCSNTSRDTLLNGLLNENAWKSFANGISGAKVLGSPTAEILMSSYNTKNGTNLDYTTYPTLDSSTENYDLYVPHTSVINSCHGYWLSSNCVVSSGYLWNVYNDGRIDNNYYTSHLTGVRPVVVLPANTQVELVDGVWETKDRR